MGIGILNYSHFQGGEPRGTPIKATQAAVINLLSSDYATNPHAPIDLQAYRDNPVLAETISNANCINGRYHLIVCLIDNGFGAQG